MSRPARVFLSYRRDDVAGYAGRLEDALEQRLGQGTAFRDLDDIAPGADFVREIRAQLAQARAVVVLIGPRWAGDGAGADGGRRIDDPADFVHIEVQEALASGVPVVPVLLPGASMPSAGSLPGPLAGLARRNAMTLSDVHWDADVDRLVAALGLAPARRAVWPWALGGAVAAAVAVGLWCRWGTGPGAGAPDDAAVAARLTGVWQAEVTYDWGDRHPERFEFRRHAGQWAGTASFLRHPRAIEQLRFDGTNLHFETRSESSMGSETRRPTQRYAAELSADGRALDFRLEIDGGFGSPRPVSFTARRVDESQAPR
ncbi:MAG: toll/interleukin-1 receptor domain-containing protein [Burkholderiaceae bacterium]|nr:toll/interleukin-1 receptor domain-containing protein [Burkholderiaceae bacterium]